MSHDRIRIKGARQNNLKGFDLELPLNELIVVTGVSGSGKSSLAFDTVYAEGQRRYVETFSPYARQFLDRMDKPAAERIDGIPPAIAIDQTNPVRTSRSTVGTMTELNDHLKLLFARAAKLYCRGCGREVRRDTPESVADDVFARAAGGRNALVTFAVTIPKNFSEEEIKGFLAQQGYTRIHQRRESELEVIQDRLRLTADNRARLIEDIEAALKHGRGKVALYPLDTAGRPDAGWRYSSALHCAECDLSYRDPIPNFFSFNSPIGACDSCRGFGRTIGVDYSLVIPDESKSLRDGAIKPWQTASNAECQTDLLRFAKKRKVPADVPWRELSDEHKRWVIDGEGSWEDKLWYGVARFFKWLEGRAYKMHVRVLLSRYRAYTTCNACHGARLKPEALLWRLGTSADADRVQASAALPGLNIHELLSLPIERAYAFIRDVHLPAPLDEAADLLLGEIRTRFDYLVQVGLGYLTLDRQSRTLSGGEVQRINLTTALGTSLVNTLFVLDEPSIGLHARDMGRVTAVLHKLRNAGNTLLVVEHDPQVMLAADRVLDIGPGPGERGGEVVFFGTPAELKKSKHSLTAQYLNGAKSVAAKPTPKPPAPLFLEVLGAQENNLKDVDIAIPLNRLVCITGVSGSGKSTLIQDVLYHALAKLKGRPKDTAGKHRAIRGDGYVQDVIMVDQSPIGRTARSNPASYVGAWDAIRNLYAVEALSIERGYRPSTFSFNAGTGRCPTCLGSGFEHVEMQFLSDIYIRCPDCDGKRFRPEVLEVKLVPKGRPNSSAKSIADVLAMTVSEAMGYFAGYPEVLRGLEPLTAVGLAYLKLGQPVPTLSGGEAQRLKLAGFLAEAETSSAFGRNRKAEPSKGPGKLFLFDEPTTGLHFDDIATLLKAFQRLLAEGHTLVVIEHNLDVIRAADWIIDLGPEGGDAGGAIVCTGTPAEVTQHASSHTGKALRDYAAQVNAPPTPRRATSAVSDNAIRVHHAREHNLKNIEARIPRERFTVITGVSGSGKSTLAFDILFNEGQRRYLESLNAYARSLVQPASRPDVDAVYGLPPTVAIEQRTSRGGRKSTVATLTEIYHFLRLLFVKLGTQYCPDCEVPIEAQTPEAILARILREQRGKKILVLAPLVTARKGFYTDLAKWALTKGFDFLRVDGAMTSTRAWPRLARFKEHSIELPVGEITVTAKAERELRALLARALDMGKGAVQITTLGEKKNATVTYSTKRSCPSCGKGFAELDPRLFSYNSKHGWCPGCYGTGMQMSGFDAEQTGEEIWWNDWFEGAERVCLACHGTRLNATAMAVRFQHRSITQYAALPVEAAEKLFGKLKLRGRDAEIARDILPEIAARLQFLQQVGLGYLSLDRSAPTLSGGEAQRIRLASQLGSNLRGVCYILDEPTIGLHHRDNLRLLDTLTALEQKGNTVVVVEHDEDTIRRAQHVIDLGPGAGKLGGHIVAAGTLDELMRHPDSITGQCIAHPLKHPLMPRRRWNKNDAALELRGVSMHNLKRLDAAIPLGRLVCVSGVSGSGKSTLVRHVLHDNLKHALSAKKGKIKFAGCDALLGYETLKNILEVDQTPIGKTPRSCPATYVGFYDLIRKLYADTAEARLRGYGAPRFSFNVAGGRCETCEGQGIKTIEMSFLPDVRVPCEVCAGRRFNAETLAVTYRDKSIADVLAMDVNEAVEFFRAHTRIHRALQLLQDVGLGYLTLGQQSPTLSGGEAQRIKLVTELAKARTEETGDLPFANGRRAKPTSTLYVLDEPTIGLHMADVEKLIRVLHRLVSAGNSVVIIEHNLDVIAEADWLIDLGPEGGGGGGRIVAQGTPEDVVRRNGSHTATVLAAFLRAHAPAN
jgi:excinuclease ABC subunit A